MTLRAVSRERYRATAAQRRLYGGATVTEFDVGPFPGGSGPTWIRVTGYGPTPGERATDAKRTAEAIRARMLAGEPVTGD